MTNTNKSNTNTPFVFFGSSRFSVIVLDELSKLNYTPNLIVTTPDKPQGRKLEIKPNIVKYWANSHNIPVLSPDKLDADFIKTINKDYQALNLSNYNSEQIENKKWSLFIVASYGKIIPNEVIGLPIYKTLNIHPSLLPQYRGASPLPTTILDDIKNTGVTIMQIDQEMDHGPIISQKNVSLTNFFSEWPEYEKFEEMMAKQGAILLAQILPDWVAGKLTTIEQVHESASYTKKIKKEDGLIDFTNEELLELKDTMSISNNNSYAYFRKIQAYHEWPQTYFFIKYKKKEIRIKITDVSFQDNKLIINKVIPEGKKEISFYNFVENYLINLK